MTLEPHTLDEGAEMPLYQHRRAPESRFHVFTASAVRFYSCKAYIPVIY